MVDMQDPSTPDPTLFGRTSRLINKHSFARSEINLQKGHPRVVT